MVLLAQKKKEDSENLKEEHLTSVVPSEADMANHESGAKDSDGQKDDEEQDATSSDKDGLPSRPGRLTLPPLRGAPGLPKSPAGDPPDNEDAWPKIPSLDELAAAGKTKGNALPAFNRKNIDNSDLDAAEGILGSDGGGPRALLKPKLPPLRRSVDDGNEGEDFPDLESKRTGQSSTPPTPGLIFTKSQIKEVGLIII